MRPNPPDKKQLHYITVLIFPAGVRHMIPHKLTHAGQVCCCCWFYAHSMKRNIIYCPVVGTLRQDNLIKNILDSDGTESVLAIRHQSSLVAFTVRTGTRDEPHRDYYWSVAHTEILIFTMYNSEFLIAPASLRPPSYF